MKGAEFKVAFFVYPSRREASAEMASICLVSFISLVISVFFIYLFFRHTWAARPCKNQFFLIFFLYIILLLLG